MANFGFIKCSRKERLKFFQSSLPYLSNNALVPSSSGKTRKWSSEDPHPSNQGFLTFKNGHYGIYFTLFNHELRKKDHDNTPFNSNKLIVVWKDNKSQSFTPEFFISKAKQEVNNDIDCLKLTARKLFSTTSLIKSKLFIKRLHQARYFSTFSFQQKGSINANKTSGVAKDISETNLEDTRQLSNIESEVAESFETDESFESHFLRSQLSQIIQTYKIHTSPDDLNVIYPLYQSLKRNDILLPSINEYNIVLKSIALRALDRETTLDATESRLTCLLTVYQDILKACRTKSSCHPNNETFQTVLKSIFGGSRYLLTFTASNGSPTHSRKVHQKKIMEFCKVGLDLYTSLLHEKTVASCEALADLLFCLNSFPQLYNEHVCAFLLQPKDWDSGDPQLFIELIRSIEFLCKLPYSRLDKRSSYDFVTHVYNAFKRSCEHHPELASAEYDVYAALLQGLIASGNDNLATKFLDELMITLQVGNAKLSESHTKTISRLTSDFLNYIMKDASLEHLNRAYNLLMIVRQVNDLPEVSVSVYHNIICKYIAEYVRLEHSNKPVVKSGSQGQTQEAIYNRIWRLYDFVAIRKDFCHTGGSTPHSTELLLSLSIDLRDTSKVSRLIKDILVKNIVIEDWGVSRKLCHLLSNEGTSNSNHFEVMWSLLESQAANHGCNSTQLNDFLSEHISHIVVEHPKTYSRIINSPFVRDAFTSFTLQSDNIHGLSILMAYFQQTLTNRLVEAVDFTKILSYQAHIINEFEDTDTHYMSFTSETSEFYSSLKRDFQQGCLKLKERHFITDNIYQACVKLGLNSNCEQLKELVPGDYKINLIPYFNMSYEKGSLFFIKLFAEGYDFDHDTWVKIINGSFASDHLEREKEIELSEFLRRMITNKSNSQSIDLVACLFSLNNERVNIKTFKFLLNNEADQILASSKTLSCLTNFARSTNNQYFFEIFVKAFPYLARLNSHKFWMSQLFERLNKVGKHTDIHDIVSQDFVYFNDGLNFCRSADVKFLENIFIAYMKLGKGEDINALFKYHFSEPAQQKLLLGSDNLLACLVEYYTYIGSYEMVIRKFDKISSRSSILSRSVQISKILSSINGESSRFSFKPDLNEECLALAVLGANDIMEMKKLYDDNSNLIKEKEKFLKTLLDGLIQVASLLKKQCLPKITAKFEAIIKFCKILQLERISAGTLSRIVEILRLSESRKLLNILFNKFVINDSLMSSFNFYFLRIDLQSKAEHIQLLHLFESCFETNGDLLNLRTVAACKAREEWA